jgi:hypothetical protein
MSRSSRGVVDVAEHVWGSDVSLSAFAVFLFCVGLFVGPLEEEQFTWLTWIRGVVDVAIALSMVSAAIAITGRLTVGLLGGCLVMAAIIARFWDRLAPQHGIALADAVLSVLAFTLLLAIVLALAFRGGPVTSHRIVGAVLGYILFAVVFGNAYAIVDLTVHHGFTGSHGGTADGRRASLMYLSIMTLTTAGYGDVTPFHPAARALSMVEAVIGQLFPVIYIGRLVSLSSSGPPRAS